MSLLATSLNEEWRNPKRGLRPTGTHPAWNIANAILFLSSAESDFITGQQIVVDGGFSLKAGWHARCRELDGREQQSNEAWEQDGRPNERPETRARSRRRFWRR